MRIPWLLFFLILGFSAYSQEQEVNIFFSPNAIEVGERVELRIVVRGAQSDKVSELPDFENFKKEGRTVKHERVSVGGKFILQHTITQPYTAEEAGNFQLEAQEFAVNDRPYRTPALLVTVHNPEEPSEELLQETKDAKNALLFLFVNKKNIYVGESIHIHLAFYVSNQNTQNWEFPSNLSQWIAQAGGQLKPKNCLESKVNISAIARDSSRIGGQAYQRYKLFEAVYYPLTDEDIVFPALTLPMNKVVFLEGDSTQTEKVNFSSRSFTVGVKPLPDSPLKNKVSVGHFDLRELTKFSLVQTGKVLNYSLELKGIGNANTLAFTKPQNDDKMDFYPPTSTVKQRNGSEFGSRTFNFKLFPKDSGKIDLGEYFNWVYFDTQKGVYDTLRAGQTINVTGKRIETYAANTGDIFDNLAEQSISNEETNFREMAKTLTNVILFVMLVGMLFIFDFKRK
ncbi:BatD family protein [Marinilongibacter aquaticus]|uniref:BatD family protein n=1 Tax=Marinilongibacter aquaticus TaxID=2975157 RepID=UPI0021BD5262|nr:BatD family protein [Marinilongibacter aquaticus]UBM58330.1 BatD family protein [Marinilongibacter aquaticus]